MPKTIPRLDSRQATTPATLSDGGRLAALLRTFGPVIYARCRRALHDEALAESAMQEVFSRIAPRLELSDARGAVAVLASACEVVCGERAFSSR